MRRTYRTTACTCPEMCRVHRNERLVRAELKRRLKEARRMGYRVTREELEALAAAASDEEVAELRELVEGPVEELVELTEGEGAQRV